MDQIIVLADEDKDGQTVLLTGAGDGLIRVMRLYPTQILGSLGTHNDSEDPIEVLSLSPNKQLAGTTNLENYFIDHFLDSFWKSRQLSPFSFNGTSRRYDAHLIERTSKIKEP